MYYSLIEKRLDGQIGKMHSPDAGKCSREWKFSQEAGENQEGMD